MHKLRPHRRLACFLAAAVTLASLAGCATPERLAAAGDVHSLLVAIRDNDHRAFEAHVDRAALEAQIQAMLVARAKAANLNNSLTSLGLVLSGPLARAAGGIVIQPEVFRAVADYYGYRPGAPVPGPLTLAAALRPSPHGQVCAARGKNGPCLLTFANEAGTWRLVGFDVGAANGLGR